MDMKGRHHDTAIRGTVAFTTGELKTYPEAEQFARKTYSIATEQAAFVLGWNMAFWNEQTRSASRPANVYWKRTF